MISIEIRIEQAIARGETPGDIVRSLRCSPADVHRVQLRMDALVRGEVAPRDSHWFVPDHTGSSCLACNCPQENGRHSRKGRAA